MRVYRDLTEVEYNKNTALTLGTFDGVHLGHRQLLNVLKNNALEKNLRTLVITFDPHPRAILLPQNQLSVLTTIDEKARLLEDYGIDSLLVIKFTHEFSEISSAQFFSEYILKSIGLRSMVVGYDFRFGKGRTGDVVMLKEFAKSSDFNIETVDEFKENDKTVSSSLIRGYLSTGSVEEANRYLGYTYSFSGKVVEGNKRGRTLGFPTANISLGNENKMIPGNGVYAVMVQGRGISHQGVMNIGIRPTFNDKPVIIPEVHLIDFDADIYGEELRVYPVVKIRDEKKFSSIDELKTQIEIDKQKSIELLKEN